MFYYILIPINLSVNNHPWEEWKQFAVQKQKKSELLISIISDVRFQYGMCVLNKQKGKVVLLDEKCFLDVNSDWSEATITLINGKIQDTYKLLNALFFTHLSTRQAIQIHASLVQIKNTGLMFLGPSGIGKTTQAELWMKFRGAEIINGDMVFVKQESDHFLGCGSPWHGSSPYCLNRQVPLSALIVLKQSQQNLIRRLTGFEMVSTVLNSVFLPSWYQEGYKAACDTVDVLLRTVPVYELSCRPDEDAVRLTEETVFGKNSILL